MLSILVSQEVCTLCNRYLGVCYVLCHLSNCIPVGHGLYIHAVHRAISLFVKVLGLASETRAFITS